MGMPLVGRPFSHELFKFASSESNSAFMPRGVNQFIDLLSVSVGIAIITLKIDSITELRALFISTRSNIYCIMDTNVKV
jgi:hypothetical protein